MSYNYREGFFLMYRATITNLNCLARGKGGVSGEEGAVGKHMFGGAAVKK